MGRRRLCADLLVGRVVPDHADHVARAKRHLDDVAGRDAHALGHRIAVGRRTATGTRTETVDRPRRQIGIRGARQPIKCAAGIVAPLVAILIFCCHAASSFSPIGRRRRTATRATKASACRSPAMSTVKAAMATVRNMSAARLCRRPDDYGSTATATASPASRRRRGAEGVADGRRLRLWKVESLPPEHAR